MISNAGGVNPDACKEQLLKLCEKQGINLDVAVVKGDNLMSKVRRSDLPAAYVCVFTLKVMYVRMCVV